MSQNPDDRTVIQPYLGFDCTQLSPTEAYRLLNHLVAPRPIAFVSTISANGIPNLAPFSFFNDMAKRKRPVVPLDKVGSATR